MATKTKVLKAPYQWFGCTMTDEIVNRFWKKVCRRGVDDCWLWMASCRHKGYGAFTYSADGKVIQDRAHRFSYQLHVGCIPKGLFVLHTCDTPACVNPKHLFLGTNLDNVRDMVAKGRHVPGGTYGPGNYPKGADHHNAKLTPDLIRKVRKDRQKGMSYERLGVKHCIGIGTAWRIVKGKVWLYVD